MRKNLLSWCAAGLLVALARAPAATLYVDAASTNAVPPFTSWATAAAIIQDAVDAAAPGDEIVVMDGVYATGGRAVYGTMTNRVAVDRPITLRSVNGPNVTFIEGAGPAGNNAVRCVYLSDGAILSGFTLTNGATRNSGDFTQERSGGGLWCQSTNSFASNCILIRNVASRSGGGAYGGALENCIIGPANRAANGGGIAAGVLTNCLVVSNSATGQGGGAVSSYLKSCTVSGNSAVSGGGGVAFGASQDCVLFGNKAGFLTVGGDGGGALGANLINCVISNNAATGNGGGAYSGSLSNCTLMRNSAVSGGGSMYGELRACVIAGNYASSFGGGSYSGTLNNCTLVGNFSAAYGGGASSSTLNNCIIYFNTAPTNANCNSSVLNYCCTTPLAAGTGNISTDPQLASLSHLSPSSPCIGIGNPTYAKGTDIDGETWKNPPAIGCDEYWSGAVTGLVNVIIQASCTNVATKFRVDFAAQIFGRVSASQWDFGDGVTVTNQPCVSHTWSLAGDYPVTLRAFSETYPEGIVATTVVHVVEQPVHYVSLASTNPLAPYTSWTTAATNIQDAVDAAFPGGTVLVTNGIYATGKRDGLSGTPNRVAVTKPITVRSVNGPEASIIRGYKMPAYTNGVDSVRCVYLTNGAALVGFTLTDGTTWSSGSQMPDQSGGGVWCASQDCIVSNCVLIGNAANAFGGAVYGGTLLGCTLLGNTAVFGGGASHSILRDSTLAGNSASYGGGARLGSLDNCIVSNNYAFYGGGVSYAALNACTIVRNWASTGGGVDSGTLTNCVLSRNSAGGAGGSFMATLDNCLVLSNSASNGGGVHQGLVANSVIFGNKATNSGGGTYHATVINCTLSNNFAITGGGAYNGNLTNCTLVNNTSSSSAGGVFGAWLQNCLVASNSTAGDGGGAYSSSMNNCTVVGNTASKSGGGAFGGLFQNCILFFNTSTNGADYFWTGWPAYGLNYSCTTFQPTNGVGNLTNTPAFVAPASGNFRLQDASPCINAGNNAYVSGTNDLAGNRRIVSSTVDIGAYEFQGNGSLISYAWLQQYGWPFDGSGDFLDPDGDGMNNWQEWRCGTVPTNALSLLTVSTPASSVSGVIVSWQSVTNRRYWIERATNLALPSGTPALQSFFNIASNLAGQSGTTIYTDATATNRGPFFYRVGVQ